ncbi:MAG: acyl-CoA synthetase [Gammaproteobacteria bacterium]|nr:acyl-CoA synthetase [Gammaproteobacteria bacterium]
MDKLLVSSVPGFASIDDLKAFAATPYTQRIAAESTYEALRLGAQVDPGAPAIEFLPNADPNEPVLAISHADFFGNITRTANMFYALGVGSGDVVSILLPLVPQAFYALFGAEAAGIANPVNAMLEPHQLAEILRAAHTKVLVTLAADPASDIWQKVASIRGELPGLQVVIQVGGGAAPPEGVLDFDTQMMRHSADGLTSGRAIRASDTAAYFHTGGTTGTPKLVRHTHGNQVYQAWVMSLMMPGKVGDKILFGLPLFHVGGALTQGLAVLCRGASLVVLSAVGWRHPNAIPNIWRLVDRFKPSTFGGVPTVLAAAAGVPIGDADVSSLTSSSGGGSAIPVAVAETLQKLLSKPVIEAYGMTETSSVHTLSYPDRPIRLGSVGHPVPYSAVRIVKLDEQGHFTGDCESGDIGVVAMAGPGVFSGYLNDAHNAGAFVEPGWVNSGDLGRLDDEGYLWITGRAKDLVIRGGHNIDPADVEEILYQHPAVAVAALVGQPDDYAGELPIAYVQLQPGAQVTREELLDRVRELTPERAAVPVDLIIMAAIPLTGVGKVFKPALRWDAAWRVFQGILSTLEGDGVEISIQVGAHGTHGSLATVRVSGVKADARAALEAEIKKRLGPFTLPHVMKCDGVDPIN